MRSDHDENERKDDEVDAAMRQHQRPAPPDDLLDRCLSTIPAARSSPDFRGPAMPVASKWGERHVLALVPWALAACFVIGAAAAFWIYNARQTDRTSTTVALLQSVDRIQSKFKANNSGHKEYDGLANGGDTTTGSDSSLVFRDGTAEFDIELNESVNKPSEYTLKSLDKNGQPFGDDVSRQKDGRGYSISPAKQLSTVGSHNEAEGATKGFDSKVNSKIKAGGKSEVTGLTNGNRGPELESKQPLSKGRIPFRTGGFERGEKAVDFSTSGGATPLSTGLSRDSRGAAGLSVSDPMVDGLGSTVGDGPRDEAQKPLRSFGRVVAPAIAREKVKELQGQLREGHTLEGLPRTSFEAEAYAAVADNPFLTVDKNPLSTFSTDVDTASYSNMRRFLSQGSRPPRDAVRIEELINYFSYDYPQPQGADPFSVNLEVAGCPWNAEHRLVRIGLKGREIVDQQRPPVNLVFLIDVSGSMQPDNKLPLLKSALRMLVQRLGENERVAIVTYANEIRLVLPSTTCDSKETIIQAIESLQAGGGTNGGGGIQLAYQVAIENFLERGVNRVILSTDGDFNIGITDRDELTRFIEEKAKSRVFLSVLGFGMGNLKDATLERLADKGNGHYAYIDTMAEARKVLVDQLNGTLVTIAKDVKLQVEFNPAKVSAYRLIGYENRVMAAQDFNDDRKDAGDIGAGHTVTALYEIVPAGKSVGPSGIEPLKYQPVERPAEPPAAQLDSGPASAIRRELLTVKLRYKQPDGTQSRLLEAPLTDSDRRYSEASRDFRFAAAVAAFGMILRDSPHRGTATLSGVLELAEDGLVADREGYRAEFLKLVRIAQSLQ